MLQRACRFQPSAGPNILHTAKRSKSNRIVHILCRNYRLERIIQGYVEVTGRRSKQLLDDHKGTWGYWRLKEEARDDSLWRTCFGRGCGRVARHGRMMVSCLGHCVTCLTVSFIQRVTGIRFVIISVNAFSHSEATRWRFTWISNLERERETLKIWWQFGRWTSSK
jgi:hypothetical protein